MIATAEQLATMPWALERGALEALFATALAGRQVDDPGAQVLELELGARAARSIPLRSGELALAGDVGQVGIVPIRGTIRASGRYYWGGSTSIDDVLDSVNAAAADPSVRHLVLAIDSPGGVAQGPELVADRIDELRGNADAFDTIVAHAGASMMSAAYWIGSAADVIVANQTAEVGSIGAILRTTDWSSYDSRRGIREITIVSSQSPRKALAPGTDEGREAYTALLDALASVFVDSVARGRHTTAEHVVEHYGQGGTYIGIHAKAAGLVDRIATLDQVVGELAAGSFNTSPAPAGAITTRERPVDLTTLHADHPSIVEAIRTEAVRAERNRIDATYLREHRPEVVQAIAAEARSSSSSGAAPEELTAETLLALFPDVYQAVLDLGADAEHQRVIEIVGTAHQAPPDAWLRALSDRTVTLAVAKGMYYDAGATRGAGELEAIRQGESTFEAPAAVEADPAKGAQSDDELAAEIIASGQAAGTIPTTSNAS